MFEKFPKTRLKVRAQLVTNAFVRPPVLRRLVVLQILLDRGSRQARLARHSPDAAAIPQDPATNLQCSFHQ
jgi:hypothetical protein